MQNKILQVALPVPLRRTFDYVLPAYLAHAPLKVGVRVLVPFGRRKLIGILVALTDKSSVAQSSLKPIIDALDQEPLFSKNMTALFEFAANYYHTPLGEIYATALPKLLRQGKPCAIRKQRKKISDADILVTYSTPLHLNQEQKYAVQQILNHQHHFNCFILEGITGSGKTEVYLQVIAELIKEKKQCLVLVPEISLTPQTLKRFTSRFGETIVMMHSGLTDNERLNNWIMARQGEVSIIIGTRSALFVPLLNPGLIIIDEEHDASFKQQDGFRYSARDLVIYRAKLENIPVVLGSATPSVDVLHHVYQQRYYHLRLTQRAGFAQHPKIHIVNLCNEKLQHGIATSLIDVMQHHLQLQRQILLFINRRGFSPVLFCAACGWSANCQRCDTKLVWHRKHAHLRCHYCDYTVLVPEHCPSCEHKQLVPVGIGTERLQIALQELFPDKKIMRIDRDSVGRKGELDLMLNDVHSGYADILIGTQMLAKGHHFPKLNCVIVVNADSGLLSHDFRATEQTAQLLVQVAGRAGRENELGEVYIQTYQAQHPLWQFLQANDYASYARKLWEDRSHAGLAPHQPLALIRIESTQREKNMLAFKKLQTALTAKSFGVELLGPAPAPLERVANRFRTQLLVRAKDKRALHHYLKIAVNFMENHFQSLRWSVDVDPIDLS